MGPKILSTPRSLTRDGHPVLDRFCAERYEPVTCSSGQQPSEDELVELLSGCVGMLAGAGRISARAINVFGKEFPGASLLVTHKRVIATPHVGGYTAKTSAGPSRWPSR